MGIVQFAPDGRWLLVNARFCELLGYGREVLLQRGVQDFTHPADREADLAQVRRALSGGGDEFHRDKRYRHRDGAAVAVSERVSLVRDASGAPDFFVAVVSPERPAAGLPSTGEEGRFQVLFDKSLEAMVVTDDQGRYLLVNDAAADLLGYPREDLLTMRVADLRSADARSAESQFAAYIEDPPQRDTFRFIRPDGEERIARYGAAEVAPGQHLSILHDITEEVRGASALRESERMLRTVLESLPVGVWIADAEGTIVYGNPAGRRVWGGEALVGVERYGEYKGWWVDTGRRIEAQDWALARALHGEVSLNELIDIETFDGERKRVLNSALPLRDDNGQVRGAMVVIEDITSRYRAEMETVAAAQRLASVVNAAADAIVNLDGRGRIESFNRAAERMFGIEPDRILGEPVERLMTLPGEREHPADATSDLKRLAAVPTAFETMARRSDASVFPVELTVSFIEDLDYFTCIIRDITQRKAAEATVRESERMAVVGSLAAGLAHDMANLVAPIRMGVSLLERLALDGQAQAAVAIISRCATSLVELTDSVMMAVRGDSAGSPQTLELSGWWDKAGPLLRAALPPGVAIRSDFSADVAPVLANESQFTRVILNLVTNAGEAIGGAGDRGGHVVVWAHPGDSAEEMLVGVRDDGPGIPAQTLERIFEPFFSTKPWSRASGLGLPSARAFASASGGSVSIETEPGRGTNIILRLRAA